MKRSRLILIFLFGFAGILIIWMINKPIPLKHFIYEGFDTWIEIDLPSHHQDISQDISSMIREMDEKWDRFDQRSEIWKINQSQEPIIVHEHTYDLLRRAQELQQRTDGFFNIFVGSLMDEWGFMSNPRIPPPNLIQDRIQQIANSSLILDGKTKSVQRTGLSEIDLGGIAKGYLVDMITNQLKKKQISPVLVNAGGTVYALGKKFRVGILHPRQKSVVGVVEVEDQAVSTSGDYYRFFEQDGIRYYHIINPYTGYPSSYFSSVTVVYPKAADADAISTAVMAGGPDLIPMMEKHFPGVVIIALQADGKLMINKAASKIFEKDSTYKFHP